MLKTSRKVGFLCFVAKSLRNPFQNESCRKKRFQNHDRNLHYKKDFYHDFGRDWESDGRVRPKIYSKDFCHGCGSDFRHDFGRDCESDERVSPKIEKSNFWFSTGFWKRLGEIGIHFGRDLEEIWPQITMRVMEELDQK